MSEYVGKPYFTVDTLFGLLSVCFSRILRKENPVSTKGDLGHTEWQELDKDLKVEIDILGLRLYKVFHAEYN